MPFTSTRGAASARGFGFATSQIPKLLQVSGSATSSSPTIDISTVTANGRLCILADNACNSTSSTPTKVIPSGFTEIVAVDATSAFVGIRHTLSYKILDGTETSLTGQSGTQSTRKMALILSVQDRLITSISISGTIGQQAVGNSTLSVQNIAATGQVAPLVLIGTYGSQSNENPAGLSDADGYLPGVASQCSLWYRIVNSGTQTATMTPALGSRAQALTSFFINVN